MKKKYTAPACLSVRISPEGMMAYSERGIQTTDNAIGSMDEQRSAGRQSPWDSDHWEAVGDE